MSPGSAVALARVSFRVGNPGLNLLPGVDQLPGDGAEGEGTAQAEAWRWEELGEWLGAAGALGVWRELLELVEGQLPLGRGHSSLPSPATRPALPAILSAQFPWDHVCQVMTARSRGQDPWAASSMALGELVLDIFTDKSLCCGGKGQCWRSAGLGTWTRKKGEA